MIRSQNTRTVAAYQIPTGKRDRSIRGANPVGEFCERKARSMSRKIVTRSA
jgi:hypothetical protein